MALGGALGPGFGAGAPRHFAWQAWHNLTSTFVSRGRRGTNWHLHHLPHTTLSHAIFHTPSQTIFSHHLSHTIFHTTLCLAPSFTTPSFTHNFVTHHLSPRHLSHNFVTHHLSPNHLSHTTLSHTVFPTQLCHTPSFTHNFRTHHLAHTTLPHTLSFLVTHQLSHTTLSHTTLFYFSVLHHLLCLSFLPRPRYNIWCFLFKEVVLWGYPVL